MTKFYHYLECGLDNIYLHNGYTLRADGTLFVQNIHGLHKAIAEALAYKPNRLKGKEIRFIRHYMDLSQRTLGELLCVDYQTVLRWETNKNPITSSADRLLRLNLISYLDPKSRLNAAIQQLSDLDNNREPIKIEMSHDKKNWEKAA